MTDIQNISGQQDRITQILQERSAALQPQTPWQTSMQNLAGIAAGRGGDFFGIQNQANQQYQQSQMSNEMGILQMMEAKKAAGDAQANALDAKIKMFTGSDPNGYASALQFLHSQPEEIDPSNPYQVYTNMAKWAKQSGYTSPEAQMQRLELQKTQAEIGKLNAVAKGGGGGSKTLQDAYVIMEKTGVDFDMAYSIAKSGMGQGNELGAGKEIQNISGYTDTVKNKSAADKFGGKQAEIVIDLPRIRATGAEAVTAIDNAIASPGMKNITGWLSLVPITPGGERARADALMDQVGGRTFLAAYEMLKGGGQITQIEGEKGEQAIATLGRAQTHEDVVSALNDLRGVIIRSIQAKEKQASQTPEEIINDKFVAPPAGGLAPDKQRRLQELRAKRDAGTLR